MGAGNPAGEPATGPLPRRATDRVEDLVAWILTVAALLVVVAAGMAGIAVHAREAANVEPEAGTTSRTLAVLLEDSVVMTGDLAVQLAVPVPARWTDRAGLEHTGAVVMSRSAPAGTEVDVWIDAAGALTGPPPRRVGAVVGGVVAAIGVVCAGATVLMAVWFAVRGVTGLVNARRWGREWARVEPVWRRTVL